MMNSSKWRRFLYASGLIVLAAVSAGTYATVQAGPSIRTVQLRDDCDPVSFNAALSPTGPPACVGDGDTTFPDFIADVTATGSSDKWRFNPVKTEADRGVNTENRGGEAHSFTEVKHFGGGFVEALNGGMTPLTECAARTPDGMLIRDAQGNLVPALPAIQTLIPAGTSSAATSLKKGVHTFQCCIHPWMQTTIVVK
jgi:plastocyanin